MLRSEENLLNQAEQLLALMADPLPPRDRLRAIEQELRTRGALTASLHQRIDALSGVEDPSQYRCCYHFE